jgi:glutathione-dependent peroxiredoxin
VSSAESVLKYLGGGVKLPPEITIFTRDDCSVSQKAKQWLKERKLPFNEVCLGKDAPPIVLRGIAGTDRVPQIFVNGQHIGGFDQLKGHTPLISA